MIRLNCPDCRIPMLASARAARQGVPCPKCGRFLHVAVPAPSGAWSPAIRRALVRAVGLVLGGAVVVGGAMLAFRAVSRPTAAAPVRVPDGAPATAKSDAPVGGISRPSQREVIQSALPMVAIGVRLTLKDGRRLDRVFATGTGFAVAPDGIVLTNAHVVQDIDRALRVRDPRDWLARYLAELWLADGGETTIDARVDSLQAFLHRHVDRVEPSVWLLFRGEQVDARLVFVSECPDLAILRCERTFPAWFRLRGTYDQETTGRDVWPLGFPGLAGIPLNSVEKIQKDLLQQESKSAVGQFRVDELEYTTTKGVFSRLRTQAATEASPEVTYIVHDGKINPGNSGGPLLDETGCVVGINTLLSGGSGGDGYSYALSIPHLRALLSRHVPRADWE